MPWYKFPLISKHYSRKVDIFLKPIGFTFILKRISSASSTYKLDLCIQGIKQLGPRRGFTMPVLCNGSLKETERLLIVRKVSVFFSQYPPVQVQRIEAVGRELLVPAGWIWCQINVIVQLKSETFIVRLLL